MILQNALVYTPRHTFERGTIIIRDGRIVPFAAPEEGEEVLDAEGLYALPGLVDIHFHGAMGKDFCDGTEEAIQALADFEASKGGGHLPRYHDLSRGDPEQGDGRCCRP